MGKVKKHTKKSGNPTRSNTPDVFKDDKAANLLSFKKKEYAKVTKNNKTRNRSIDKGKIQRAKKPREYTEKELGIPKLNKALDPVGATVKGKKGKKFVSDDTMQLILSEVNEKNNARNASKLEKARQLEEIRELKRKEIEEREKAQHDKLESKKVQLKKGKPKPEPKPEPQEKPRKKRVTFA